MAKKKKNGSASEAAQRTKNVAGAKRGGSQKSRSKVKRSTGGK